MNIYVLLNYIHQLPIVNILHLSFNPLLPTLSPTGSTSQHCDTSHPNTSARILCLIILSVLLALHRSFLQPNEPPQLLVSYIYCLLSLYFCHFPYIQNLSTLQGPTQMSLDPWSLPSQFSFCCLCNCISLIAFFLAPPLFIYMSHIPNSHKHLRTGSVSNSNLYFPQILAQQLANRKHSISICKITE